MKLLLDAVTKFVLGLISVCALVFLPAGTLKYFNGWIFVSLLFVPMLAFGAVLFCKSPKLLEKRLNSKEQRKTQKGVAALCGIIFIGGFVTAGLDFRFGWSDVPLWCIIIASLVLLISYALYAEVMRENIYLSRTVVIQNDQKVIDTGLYGLVRHPMYFSTVFMFLSIPIILGSWLSLIFFGFYPIVISARIKDEETLLKKELNGYEEYTQKVKYRLLPFIW